MKITCEMSSSHTEGWVPQSVILAPDKLLDNQDVQYIHGLSALFRCPEHGLAPKNIYK